MRVKAICVLSALLLTTGAATRLHAQVEGRIVRVGLFAGAQPLVRTGNWSFVEVALRWRGDGPFDGELRVDQTDRDGDVVTSVRPVPLAPDGQWHSYEVYFVPHDVGSGGSVQVRLFDDNGRLARMLNDRGEAVGELVSDPVYEWPAGDFLIVDLSAPRRLPHVAWLDSERRRKDGWVNARKTRAMLPRELPSRWQGLEMVDAIVWDDADATGLSRQQADALVDWVKAGGSLLITAGTNWQALAHSHLAAALPVTITGIDQVWEAQEFLDIVREEEYQRRLDRAYLKHPITRCRMTPAPDAVPIPAQCDNPQIAYRRLLGRGMITFVGASLRELLPSPAKLAAAEGFKFNPDETAESLDKVPFIRHSERIVGRIFLGLADVRDEESGPMLVFDRPDLFNSVRRSVGFESLGAAFLIFAILFAIAYTGVATVGSYWYLKRRGWTQHAWTAFAGVSLVCGLLGTGMVWVLRGVTTQVWQTSVVDASAGEDYGTAMCLFGVKTPNHTDLDLRLPVGSLEETGQVAYGPLRVTPADALPGGASRYVAPEDYECVLAGANLIGVPVRATLKEFQGFWHGPLGGVLEARLFVSKDDAAEGDVHRGEIGRDSYIRNMLGVTLKDCYLLSVNAETALKAAYVHCYRLGDIPASGPGSELDGEQIRQRLYDTGAPEDAAGDSPQQSKRPQWLHQQIGIWAGRLRPSLLGGVEGAPVQRLTADQEYLPLLLLSVFDLLDEDTGKKYGFRRSYGRKLDCTHRLTKNTALLIGHCEEPPPAVLEINRANYEPNRSRTIYRFLIPVQR